jgi:hypothetical protein
VIRRLLSMKGHAKPIMRLNGAPARVGLLSSGRILCQGYFPASSLLFLAMIGSGLHAGALGSTTPARIEGGVDTAHWQPA